MSYERNANKANAITDEQIADAVANDPDAIDTSAPEFWSKAKVRLPETKEQSDHAA